MKLQEGTTALQYPEKVSNLSKIHTLIIKNKIIHELENQADKLKPAIYKMNMDYLTKIGNYICKYLSYF